MPAIRLPFVALLGLIASAALAGAADPQSLTIVTFGDSTTAPRGKLLTVYSDLLREELPKRGRAVEVINAGIGGNTTEKARVRFERDVLNMKPDLVVIQFGINDAAVDVWKDPPATESRVTLERYEENLRYFVRTLKARGTKVILMTSNAVMWSKITLDLYGKPPYDRDDPFGFNVVLRKYVEIPRKVAREENVGLVEIFALYAEKGEACKNWLLDGMHPNNDGQRLVFDKLLPEIEKQLMVSPRR